jgi:hypothetical protein
LNPPKLVIFALAALVLLFAVALGFAGRTNLDGVGSPSGSRLRIIEDIFPPRTLSATDVRRAGAPCLAAASLTIPSGGQCSFMLPSAVRRVILRKVPSSPPMTVTVSQTGGVTETLDTAKPGSDPKRPNVLSLAVPDKGSILSLSNCAGPGECRIDLGS